MEQDIKELKSLVIKQLELSHGQSKSLARLETSVMGDKEAGLEGLVGRTKKLEIYIDTDKKAKWTMAGALAAFSALISWLFK